MNEFKEIKRYVANYIQLTTEEEDYFISLLRITKVKKRQCIVQPDFTCKYRSYVLKGAMRAYLVDNKAQTHTLAFAIEDWWISDFNSYINQEPATSFVEALEDTILIQLDYDSEQLLLEKIPKFERFFRIIAQRSFAFLQRRMLSNLSKTAEERYDEFIQKYPAIVNRVPQYALASYLGFSTVFLSKIRNKKAK
ncbi:Crp/Fnr family transcriptional regulator [Flavobacterium soyangense]|uniref:Crp/Fnr family transcriptional regulator n=1 Tax=Flavobacterium soyangense TaxID=2023265 RepID=A0A930XVM8_9FLAO|nr:Crp/Fnr family transcriptional regulator [Flavobacterium soyangense]MBF2709815.1 Crp/Fnr family transcriptional regulator [Flavobacterium soyangense]